MSGIKGMDFQIAFNIDDPGSCRSVIRNWIEVEGYVEIVYQEYDSNNHIWVDVVVTPAYSGEDVDRLIKTLQMLKEGWFDSA